MKDFYMVIYLVKQLMPGDEEALKQHLIKDYVYFHAFRNPAKVFSTFLSDEKELKEFISNNDIYHLQRLSKFVKIERSTGFKVFRY